MAPLKETSDFHARLEWMVYAGSQNPDGGAPHVFATASEELISVLELEEIDILAEELKAAQRSAPKFVNMLMRNDLSQAADLLGKRDVGDLSLEKASVLAARVTCYWAVFGLQIEGVSGAKSIFCPFGLPESADVSGTPLAWTVGQTFSAPRNAKRLGAELFEVLGDNLRAGRTEMTDKRTGNRWQREFNKCGFQAPFSLLPEKYKGLASLSPAELYLRMEQHQPRAEIISQKFEHLCEGGTNRRIDSITSPLSVLARLAIVAARTYDVTVAAQRVKSAAEYRQLLRRPKPAALHVDFCRLRDNRSAIVDVVHLARLLYLRDPSHLSQSGGTSWNLDSVPLTMDTGDRRARKAVDEARAFLATDLDLGKFDSLVGWRSRRHRNKPWR